MKYDRNQHNFNWCGGYQILWNQIVLASNNHYFQDSAEEKKKDGHSSDGYLWREGVISFILMVPLGEGLYRSMEYSSK